MNRHEPVRNHLCPPSVGNALIFYFWSAVGLYPFGAPPTVGEGCHELGSRPRIFTYAVPPGTDAHLVG
jgi:hypothetical protein